MANPEVQAFYYANTNRLHITNTRSRLAGGGILNGAVGTAQILDKDQNAIVGQDPIVLAAVAGEQGGYEAIFPVTVPPLAKKQFLNILVLLEGGPNLKYRGIIEAKVVENVQ